MVAFVRVGSRGHACERRLMGQTLQPLRQQRRHRLRLQPLRHRLTLQPLRQQRRQGLTLQPLRQQRRHRLTLYSDQPSSGQ